MKMWKSSAIFCIGNLSLLLLLNLLPTTLCLPDANAIRSDLTTLNAICRGLDSCKDNRTSDSLIHYNCHCGSFCRDLDTCCLDSPSRSTWRQVPRFVAKCLGVYGRRDLDVFMVDTCRRSWRDADDDGFVRDMCASNGEDKDDSFLAVPVTSLRTGATYKNYYCAVCNENPPDGQVAFWNVELRSRTKTLSDPTERDLQYDSTQSSWTMENDEGLSVPVTLVMQIPDNVLQKVKTCRSSGLVSECSSDWADASTAEKCSAYTALVSTSTNGPFLRYKNPHCAICNYEQVYALDCEESLMSNFGTSNMRKTFFVGLFILEEEGRRKRCSRDQVYDGLAKKCRTVRCPKNHTLRNRKCVPDRS